MSDRRLGSGESKLETAISYLLIVGVIVSLVLELVGIVLLYRSYGNLAISQDPSLFIRGRDFFSFIYQQLAGSHQAGAGIFFMTAGIIVLILTPYVRLVASVVYFALEKNTKYVVITLFVLIVVTLSLTLH
jgi:uncharacterized membrane protein